MENIQKITGRFSRRLFLHLALHRFITLMIPYLFAWGTLAVILRIALDIPKAIVLSGLGGALPVWLIALGIQYRRHPKKNQIAALLDAGNSAGGLIMTAIEKPLHEWNRQLNTTRQPDIIWQRSFKPLYLLLAAVYVCAAATVPAVSLEGNQKRPFQIKSLVGDLQQKADLLYEEEVINESVRAVLNKELQLLTETAEGADPAATWESLDHLETRLKDRAAEYAESLSNSLDAMQQAGNMADILQQLPSSTKIDRQALTGELSAMIESSRSAFFNRDDLRDTDLVKALQKRHLSPSQMKKLQKRLQQRQRMCKNSINQLKNKQLIPPDMCPESARRSKEGERELARYVKENAPQLSTEEIIYMCRGKRTGKGGIQRGRADAVLTWKNKTDESGARFKETLLPITVLPLNEQSLLAGETGYVPPASSATKPAASTSPEIKNTADSGGVSGKQTILPRHREAVRRYFKRTE